MVSILTACWSARPSPVACGPVGWVMPQLPPLSHPGHCPEGDCVEREVRLRPRESARERETILHLACQGPWNEPPLLDANQRSTGHQVLSNTDFSDFTNCFLKVTN